MVLEPNAPSAKNVLLSCDFDLIRSFLLRSNVVVRYATILAPYDSPNTDGIDPGTCLLSK